MGTNYRTVHNTCDCCKRGDDGYHIGKSSAGWAFALNTHPDASLETLEDWVKLWLKPGVIIMNEYGDVVPVQEMLEQILCRNRPDLRHGAAGDPTIIRVHASYDVYRGNFS